MNRCPTCGRNRKAKVDPAEARVWAIKGVSVTRAAEMLGVHRTTLVRVARELDLVFRSRPGLAYVPAHCARDGERNGRAKITRAQARAIYRSRDSTGHLAMVYSLSTVQINKIRRGVSWR